MVIADISCHCFFSKLYLWRSNC